MGVLQFLHQPFSHFRKCYSRDPYSRRTFDDLAYPSGDSADADLFQKVKTTSKYWQVFLCVGTLDYPIDVFGGQRGLLARFG